MDNLDLHLTALFTWAFRTLGKALVWAFTAAVVAGIAAAAIDEPGLYLLAGLVGPLVFGWQLMSAEAPFPVGDEVDHT